MGLPGNTNPSLSDQSANDLLFNPGSSGSDTGPLRAESQFVPFNQPVGRDTSKFTPTIGQSKSSSPSKPSDVTQDTKDDQEGTMYDGQGNVLPPDKPFSQVGTGVFGTGLGAGIGAYFGSKIPIPGADKAMTTWGGGIGGAIGYSTPFNHAINRGANTILHPNGGMSPGMSKEEDITPFLRE